MHIMRAAGCMRAAGRNVRGASRWGMQRLRQTQAPPRCGAGQLPGLGSSGGGAGSSSGGRSLQQLGSSSAASRRPALPPRVPHTRGPYLRRRGDVSTQVATVLAGEMLHGNAAMGSQALLWYGFVCTLWASLGASSMHALKLAWEKLGLKDTFEGTSKARLVLHGVEIPSTSRLNSGEVQRAVELAAMAHAGQVRKTGEPYVTHCIETALIVEQLLSPDEEEERKRLAVVVALLHDVVDDTPIRLDHVEQAFGRQVARKVDKVTKISQMNQLMRRLERTQGKEPKRETLDEMRDLILQMVHDPLVLLVKLADRLHNMRTVHALAPAKRGPVARETLRVWCALAERLGLFPLKAELEDLCFAALQPERFAALREELDELWGLDYAAQAWAPAAAQARPASASPSMADLVQQREEEDDDALLFEFDGEGGGGLAVGSPLLQRQQLPSQRQPSGLRAAAAAVAAAAAADEGRQQQPSYRGQVPRAPRGSEPLTQEQRAAAALLRAVVPFTATRFSTGGDGWLARCPGGEERGLGALVGAARELHRELALGGHVLGLPVRVQGRLKSLYSVHRKMRRKGYGSAAEVLDARALRVIVGDDGRTQLHAAVAGCYRLNDVVERLWRPIHAEADDYIANPKPSGYQSLHNAVCGAGSGLPFEVQIRTESMHRDAEYGAAAHWAYKEAAPAPQTAAAAAPGDSSTGSVRPPTQPAALREVLVGQPLWRISEAGIMDGVVVRSGAGGRQLLVACTSSRRDFGDSMCATSGEYAAIARYVEAKGYWAPGQGDLQVYLEAFSLCSDGKYHRVDHCGHKHPGTTVVPLFRLTEHFGSVCAAAGTANAAAEAAAAPIRASLGGGAGEWLGVGEALGRLPGGQSDQDEQDKQQLVEHEQPASVSSTGSFDSPYDELLDMSPRCLAATAAAAGVSAPLAGASPPEAPSPTSAAAAQQQAAAVVLSARPSDELAAELAAHSARVNHLRRALESPAAAGRGASGARAPGDAVDVRPRVLPGEKVLVMVWPTGEVRRVERGTTAGHIIATQGEIVIDAGGRATTRAAQRARRAKAARLVNVNNRLVPESTPLKSGDYVVLSRDILEI